MSPRLPPRRGSWGEVKPPVGLTRLEPARRCHCPVLRVEVVPAAGLHQIEPATESIALGLLAAVRAEPAFDALDREVMPDAHRVVVGVAAGDRAAAGG